MTWVVAGRGLFCATAMSDIQVTLTYPNGNRTHVDALRKVHVLDPRVVILFSGSVQLALAVIRALEKELMPRLDERLFEDPLLVANQIRRSILYFYDSFRNKTESAQFIVLITPVGQYTSFGVYKLCPPKFTPVAPEDAFGVVEIGSGSIAEEYRAMVKQNSVGMLTVQVPGEFPAAVIRVGRLPMRDLSRQALNVRKAGVSHAVYLTLMTHESASYDFLPADPDDSPADIASTWTEFVELMKARGISMADAVATAA